MFALPELAGFWSSLSSFVVDLREGGAEVSAFVSVALGAVSVGAGTEDGVAVEDGVVIVSMFLLPVSGSKGKSSLQ